MLFAYLLWLSIFVFFPLALIHLWRRDLLREYASVYALAVLGALLFSIPWDIISVRERIWYFTEPEIIGVWVFGLPLEEYLFIVFVTILFVDLTLLLYEKYGVRL